MRVFHVALALLMMTALAGCSAPVAMPAAGGVTAATASPERLRIVATVSPITNVVYNIAGDRAELAGIVPEGVNSHTYEPAPSDARQLAAADLIFINGLKLEAPTLQLAEANARDGAEIVLLGDQTIAPDAYVYDFSFPKEAGSPNPHLWPNPFYTLKYAEIIRDKLSARDPQNADYYAANYAKFEARIQALDAAIQATVDSIPPENRKLLTYHDSWAYFAPLYGMTVVGAIQPSDFAEPSARELVEIIEQLKAEQVPAIFGSEVFASPVLEQIARETGATYVDDLRDDDLPGQPGDDNHSYFGLMAENLRIMAEALGGDPSIMAAFDTRNVTGADNDVAQNQ
ncbi:metal ABC transporter substrate-binding protein [Caldilinea sp.]|uniref:metal ABC transporter substrate-binding protein n=1 Tax=Caldilinea sp. TaxID=2293560 RepID=UPI002BFA9D20|nr:metal ABC transporter substrate-binding protein [Caldilinea sp.]